MLSNATAPPSSSSRIQRPAKSEMSSVRRKPRSSSCSPVKSIGIILETSVNAPGGVSFRSIRNAQRPPCTICGSTANVPAGAPPQPLGTRPTGSASKSSSPASSGRPAAGCGVAPCDVRTESRQGKATNDRIVIRIEGLRAGHSRFRRRATRLTFGKRRMVLKIHSGRHPGYELLHGRLWRPCTHHVVVVEHQAFRMLSIETDPHKPKICLSVHEQFARGACHDAKSPLTRQREPEFAVLICLRGGNRGWKALEKELSGCQMPLLRLQGRQLFRDLFRLVVRDQPRIAVLGIGWVALIDFPEPVVVSLAHGQFPRQAIDLELQFFTFEGLA